MKSIVTAFLFLGMCSQAIAAKTICSAFHSNYKKANKDLEKRLHRKRVNPYKTAMVPSLVGAGKNVAVCQSYGTKHTRFN